jgi:nuclear receptor co-repressor 1
LYVTCIHSSSYQEEDKKMRMLAIIPPMMLDARQRRMRFFNNNGLLEDPLALYKEQIHTSHWSQQERQTFQEKYLQAPKNFVSIAQCLPKKVRILFCFVAASHFFSFYA